MVNEVLGVPNIPNDSYEAKLKDIYMKWLRDSLVNEEYKSKIYCPTTKGLTSAYARRWLTLVGRRTRLSDNLTDVTYP